MNPLLLIDDVHKRYGAHAALRGFSLSLAPGEIVCLLGASGSGKTTLLRIVAGLEQVDSGRVMLDGELVDAPGTRALPAQRRGLGMVFQDYALWPHLSALDNVALPLRARRRADAAGDAQRMLERVGLAELGARRPHELSGGQQQRVALARALAVKPRLLLCDEPLSNLDAALREELRELIGAVVREHGLAALYITHDQREALALGDRVGIVDQGRLRQLDTPQALLRAPCDETVARFIHARGPWPAHVAAGTLHTPWGRQPAPAGAHDGARRLYLRGTALRLAGTGPADAHAQWCACVPSIDGVELKCTLHGVPLRLPAAQAPAAGDAIGLRIDPEQMLLYPANESIDFSSKESNAI